MWSLYEVEKRHQFDLNSISKPITYNSVQFLSKTIMHSGVRPPFHQAARGGLLFVQLQCMKCENKK